MDNRSEVREFLTSRRARVTAQQAGLVAYGARRVQGLRRGEVAQLAGVSVEYYTELERGDLSGAAEGAARGAARPGRADRAGETCTPTGPGPSSCTTRPSATSI